ncbi:sigma 54-interacting transcriptional regulator [Candidatus Nitrotoga sp. M5]|uniref:sigma 54-interacting transcriptional regulator n=1 Tax=Candidatus Nitrotoga sp. M5 TaxID=2890409 RepID=UPI001EF62219|nr:sigma-54 dependent transcriptional regulator [Candidatus Nitrotoga sp. M5]CAH1388169.1 Regulatory Fis family protein [Candidatus Nitrotoga sp. M5]
MIGQSRIFLETLGLVERISNCNAPVLIEGETGTGKELVARAIHYGGPRREYPFVAINCGAIPDDLVENELFGHTQGAYTGAQSANSGLITQAHRGTLFLDEVDSLSPKAQVTLLRFLQDHSYRPIGAGEMHCADVRIVVASNADLGKLTERGAFRLDLLFRLKILNLKLPPLRERQGDAALLAVHFLHACVEKFSRGDKTLHPATLAWFDQYCWPGNVRELENMIYREYLLENSTVIRFESPALVNGERRTGIDRRRKNLTSMDFNEAKNHEIEKFEKNYLVEMLIKMHGNVTKAAKLAGKERRAFGKLLKKYGINKNLYCL